MQAISDILLPIVAKINSYLADYVLILLLVGAGNEVVRFLPPLNVTKEELDTALERFEAAVAAL